LADRRSRFAEVFTAARATAGFVADEGEREEAEALEAVTREAEEVWRAPSLENVQAALDHLAKTVRENEERRQGDHQSDRAFAFLLAFIPLYITVYLALWPNLVRL
jgi:Flp pilus assembly protein TadB